MAEQKKEPLIIKGGGFPAYMQPDSQGDAPPVSTQPLRGTTPEAFHKPVTPAKPESDDELDAWFDEPKKKRKPGRPKGSKNKKTLSREASRENLADQAAAAAPQPTPGVAMDVPSPSVADIHYLRNDVPAQQPPPARPNPPRVPAHQPHSHPAGSAGAAFPQPRPSPLSAQRLEATDAILRAHATFAKKLDMPPITRQELNGMSDADFNAYAVLIHKHMEKLENTVDLEEMGVFFVLRAFCSLDRIPDFYEAKTGKEAPSFLRAFEFFKLDGPNIDTIGVLEASPVFRSALREFLREQSLMDIVEQMDPTTKLLAVTTMILGGGILTNLGLCEPDMILDTMGVDKKIHADRIKPRVRQAKNEVNNIFRPRKENPVPEEEEEGGVVGGNVPEYVNQEK